MSIFDLEHIFIVFHPGAGGNFIASLLESIINNNTNPIVIGSSGAAHTTNNRKIKGIDYLSFGTEVYEQSSFTSENDRVNFYLDKIKYEYKDVTTRQVVWTHDFTNINLYKKYFPNSKILAITQQSLREKMAVVLFNVTKNILDENTINPLTTKRMNEVLSMWNYVVNIELVKLLGEDKARVVSKNSTLYKYVSFLKMIQYYMLDTGSDVVNRVLYPSNTFVPGKLPYTIGKPYDTYISDCVVLPYEYIMDDRPDMLVDQLTTLVPLTTEQINFIVENYNSYRRSQNQEILSDPMQYFNRLKQEAIQT